MALLWDPDTGNFYVNDDGLLTASCASTCCDQEKPDCCFLPPDDPAYCGDDPVQCPPEPSTCCSVNHRGVPPNGDTLFPFTFSHTETVNLEERRYDPATGDLIYSLDRTSTITLSASGDLIRGATPRTECNLYADLDDVVIGTYTTTTVASSSNPDFICEGTHTTTLNLLGRNVFYSPRGTFYITIGTQVVSSSDCAGREPLNIPGLFEVSDVALGYFVPGSIISGYEGLQCNALLATLSPDMSTFSGSGDFELQTEERADGNNALILTTDIEQTFSMSGTITGLEACLPTPPYTTGCEPGGGITPPPPPCEIDGELWPDVCCGPNPPSDICPDNAPPVNSLCCSIYPAHTDGFYLQPSAIRVIRVGWQIIKTQVAPGGCLVPWIVHEGFRDTSEPVFPTPPNTNSQCFTTTRQYVTRKNAPGLSTIDELLSRITTLTTAGVVVPSESDWGYATLRIIGPSYPTTLAGNVEIELDFRRLSTQFNISGNRIVNSANNPALVTRITRGWGTPLTPSIVYSTTYLAAPNTGSFPNTTTAFAFQSSTGFIAAPTTTRWYNNALMYLSGAGPNRSQPTGCPGGALTPDWRGYVYAEYTFLNDDRCVSPSLGLFGTGYSDSPILHLDPSTKRISTCGCSN